MKVLILKRRTTAAQRLDASLSGKVMFKPMRDVQDTAEFLADEFYLCEKWLAHSESNLTTFKTINAPQCLINAAQKRVTEWKFRKLVCQEYSRARSGVMN